MLWKAESERALSRLKAQGSRLKACGLLVETGGYNHPLNDWQQNDSI